MTYPRPLDDPDLYEDQRGAWQDAADAPDADWDDGRPSASELAAEEREEDDADGRYADGRDEREPFG